jgi:hypothetical protein
MHSYTRNSTNVYYFKAHFPRRSSLRRSRVSSDSFDDAGCCSCALARGVSIASGGADGRGVVLKSAPAACALLSPVRFSLTISCCEDVAAASSTCRTGTLCLKASTYIAHALVALSLKYRQEYLALLKLRFSIDCLAVEVGNLPRNASNYYLRCP